MPSRYLRASYIDSKRINKLSAEGERMFCRLLVHVDDFGRCEADADLLRGKLFARKQDEVSSNDVSTWLVELADNGLIVLYAIEGHDENFLQMTKWERGRAMKSKFPPPPNTVDELPDDDGDHHTCADFDKFWSAYPKKIGKSACLKKWRTIKGRPSIDEILNAIERQKKSEQWMKEGGTFIPHPHTWLNQGRWEDVHATRKTARSFEE